MAATPLGRRMEAVSTHHAMSHADAAWLRMDRPTNLMVINALLWFDEVPDWDRLREAYADQIVEHFPRFRQVARPGGPLGGAPGKTTRCSTPPITCTGSRCPLRTIATRCACWSPISRRRRWIMAARCGRST
jgi:hypothetical protein